MSSLEGQVCLYSLPSISPPKPRPRHLKGTLLHVIRVYNQEPLHRSRIFGQRRKSHGYGRDRQESEWAVFGAPTRSHRRKRTKELDADF